MESFNNRVRLFILAALVISALVSITIFWRRHPEISAMPDVKPSQTRPVFVARGSPTSMASIASRMKIKVAEPDDVLRATVMPQAIELCTLFKSGNFDDVEKWRVASGMNPWSKEIYESAFSQGAAQFGLLKLDFDHAEVFPARLDGHPLMFAHDNWQIVTLNLTRPPTGREDTGVVIFSKDAPCYLCKIPCRMPDSFPGSKDLFLIVRLTNGTPTKTWAVVHIGLMIPSDDPNSGKLHTYFPLLH